VAKKQPHAEKPPGIRQAVFLAASPEPRFEPYSHSVRKKPPAAWQRGATDAESDHQKPISCANEKTLQL
jgi:hypothetical protein